MFHWATLATAASLLSAPARAAEQPPPARDQTSVDDVMKGIVESYERVTRSRLDRARQRLGVPPPVSASAPAPQAGSVIQDCPECPPLRKVQPGRFTLGSPVSEQGRGDDETQRDVVIPRAFALGVREITAREFAAFRKAARYNPKADCYRWRDHHLPQSERQRALPLDWETDFTAAPDSPATCISWDDATAYVSWLSRKTGQTYRLPSEAEWEYAARAGTTTPYWWGTSISANQALYGQTVVTLAAAPRQPSPANPWGFHDMNGSVWEWAQDCYAARYSDRVTSGSPTSQPQCSQRAGRGGSWGNAPSDLRAANRLKAPPAYRSSLFGFRVVREL